MMGGQRLFAGYLRDMSEHKQAQEKIARLSRIHAVLSGINSVIVRVRDRMVDLSVRGRLEALRLSLRNARLGSTGGES